MPSTRPPVVYSHTFEAFVRDVLERKGLLTDELRHELLGKGIDVRKPRDLAPELWHFLLDRTAALIEPGKPRPHNLERIGRELVRAFAESFVGKSVFVVLRMLGPRRATHRTAANFGTSDNYTTVVVKEVTPQHFEITYSPVADMPELVLGIFAESMVLLEIKNPRATFALTPGVDAAVFSLQWDG